MEFPLDRVIEANWMQVSLGWYFGMQVGTTTIKHSFDSYSY